MSLPSICMFLCNCVGQSYEIKLKRLKEGSGSDEQLLKVLIVAVC